MHSTVGPVPPDTALYILFISKPIIPGVMGWYRVSMSVCNAIVAGNLALFQSIGRGVM
ncbi:hypothetical protein LOC71_19240 [Rhodopirellula sp. JC740]|uniref:Uncharacterized protein n=1 Tax=Rhodopirellula halodulae TaxID=2894198 RepID=A0ABS8NNP7_9BACT|nr:hypothetical protein [Rhodopirellula sp. JC740]MCC9644413.1 hypothetical protein [Rhodopirellula sp. JC740]